MVQGVNLNYFVKDDSQNPCWSVGVHISILKPEWVDHMRNIQHYLTCDGIYSKIFWYHTWFIVHLAGFNRMNLPFYLHQILLKMVASARKRRVWYPHDVYHHGLIKMLYTHELNKKAQHPRRTLEIPFLEGVRRGKLLLKGPILVNKLLYKQEKNLIGEKIKLLDK